MGTTEWLTVAVVFLGLATLASTVSFHRWTVRQRRPSCVVVENLLRYRASTLEAVEVIYNPGETSAFIIEYGCELRLGRSPLELVQHTFHPREGEIKPRTMREFSLQLSAETAKMLRRIESEGSRGSKVRVRYYYSMLCGDVPRTSTLSHLNADWDEEEEVWVVSDARAWLYHPLSELAARWGRWRWYR